jgi:hypothetical protein
LPVLTLGFGDRDNGGVRPAVKRRRRRRWYSVLGYWGHREDRRRGAVSAVRRGGGGVHFIGPGRRPAVVEFYSSSASKELKGKRRRDNTDSVGEVKAA